MADEELEFEINLKPGPADELRQVLEEIGSELDSQVKQWGTLNNILAEMVPLAGDLGQLFSFERGERALGSIARELNGILENIAKLQVAQDPAIIDATTKALIAQTREREKLSQLQKEAMNEALGIHGPEITSDMRKARAHETQQGKQEAAEARKDLSEAAAAARKEMAKVEAEAVKMAKEEFAGPDISGREMQRQREAEAAKQEREAMAGPDISGQAMRKQREQEAEKMAKEEFAGPDISGREMQKIRDKEGEEVRKRYIAEAEKMDREEFAGPDISGREMARQRQQQKAAKKKEDAAEIAREVKKHAAWEAEQAKQQAVGDWFLGHHEKEKQRAWRAATEAKEKNAREEKEEGERAGSARRQAFHRMIHAGATHVGFGGPLNKGMAAYQATSGLLGEGVLGTTAAVATGALVGVAVGLKSISDAAISFASVANPALATRFDQALKDVSGAIGFSMIPYLELATDAVRLFGDVMATIMPSSEEARKDLEPARAALDDLRESAKTLTPALRELASAGFKEMANELKIAIDVTSLFIAQQGGLFTGKAPDKDLQSSFGASGFNASMSGSLDYARKAQVAAFQATVESARERNIKALDDNTKALNNKDKGGNSADTAADPNWWVASLATKYGPSFLSQPWK